MVERNYALRSMYSGLCVFPGQNAFVDVCIACTPLGHPTATSRSPPMRSVAPPFLPGVCVTLSRRRVRRRITKACRWEFAISEFLLLLFEIPHSRRFWPPHGGRLPAPLYPLPRPKEGRLHSPPPLRHAVDNLVDQSWPPRLPLPWRLRHALYGKRSHPLQHCAALAHGVAGAHWWSSRGDCTFCLSHIAQERRPRLERP